MARKFKTVSQDWQSWDEAGLVIEGYISDKKSAPWGDDEIAMRTVQNEDGSLTAFSTPLILEQSLQLIEAGEYVRITYVGEKESRSGRTMKDFMLEVADDS